MKIKELRQENNKRQGEVANDLGLTQTAYSYYENDKREPDIETLKKIAQYFHVSVDYLVDNNTPYLIDKSKFTNKQLSLVEKIQNLNDEQCSLLDAYVEGMIVGQKERQALIEKFKK